MQGDKSIMLGSESELNRRRRKRILSYYQKQDNITMGDHIMHRLLELNSERLKKR